MLRWMNTPLAFLTLDIATAICAALFGARVFASAPRRPSAQLIALIALCNLCHIVLARYEYAQWIPVPYQIDVGNWSTVLNLVRNLTPGLFAILSFALFADKRRFPPALIALFAVQVFLEAPLRWVMPADWPYLREAAIAAATLQMVFAGFAIYWAVESWRSDLIDARRSVRALTVLVIGLDVFAASFLLRVVVPENTLANYLGHEAFIAINLAILLFLLYRADEGQVNRCLEPEPAPSPPRSADALDAQSALALARLAALFQSDHIHHRPGLSLKLLAHLVGLPEYRLRKLIHEQLGFRNFNEFLHAHRIADACRQLRDPALRRTPILTIALSVGYESINTFNRGFREVMGTTPSAYRERPVDAPSLTEILSPKTE